MANRIGSNARYDDLVEPGPLSRFLAVNHWAKTREVPGGWQTWRAPDELESRPRTVIVPLDPELEDYSPRMSETVSTLLSAYELNPQGLIEKIASARADLLFVRIDQDSYDGTISFRQAQNALANIATMVKAAATTAVDPQHSHKGRRPAAVESFLSDDFRMGHTKKGSFIVTVAVRHEWDIESDGATEDKRTTEGSGLVEPLSRRVMTTLSRGLNGARKYALIDSTSDAELTTDSDIPTDSEADSLSFELATALERITDNDGLKSFSVEFDWSQSLSPPPDDVVENVVFTRDEIDSLPAVADRLQKREVPKRVQIVGQVFNLSHPIDAPTDDQEQGEVTIFAEVDGSARKIVVELEGENYDLAIQAYRHRLPVTISGDLIKRRNWRIEGDVELEHEQLRVLLSALSGMEINSATSKPDSTHE